MFANRVADGAKDAAATIELRLAGRRVRITRRLKDLTLLHFQIEDEVLARDETLFQRRVVDLVGLWSFGDWVLLLRHLVFYFEDRRALVWDPTAQRQLLRMLFLTPDKAKKWTEDEREILELDTRLRNLRAVLGGEERALAQSEAKTKAGADVREELKVLGDLQGADTERLEKLQ